MTAAHRHAHRQARRRVRHIGVAVAIAATAAGCGISPDTAPRDIDLAGASVDQRSGNPQAAIGEGEVYFVVQEGGVRPRLVAVSRDVDAAAERGDPTSVLDALLDGPNSSERNNEVTTLLPVGLDALGVSTRPGGVVVIDLTEPFGELTGQNLVVALAQVVHTISEVGGVNGVRITVEGESRAWPDAIGLQQSDPLTVYDYPGLVRSSQPAFPAIPSD